MKGSISMKPLKIKKTMLTALALMMLIPTSAFAKNAPKTGDLPPQARNRAVEFQVNGKKVNANPDMGKWFISESGRTYLPIRLFKDKMGYKMIYDTTVYGTRALVLTKDKEGMPSYREIYYGHNMDRVDPVDDDVCIVYDNQYGDSLYFDKSDLPILYGNRLYMPARKIR